MHDKVIRDCSKRKVNKCVWSLTNYNELFVHRLLSINDVFTTKFVSIVNVVCCGYSQFMCFNYFT